MPIEIVILAEQPIYFAPDRVKLMLVMRTRVRISVAAAVLEELRRNFGRVCTCREPP